MANEQVKIIGRYLQVTSLQIREKHVVEFFRDTPSTRRTQTFVHALELGISCMSKARMSQDVELVRTQLAAVLTDVETSLDTIVEKTERAVLEKIGTQDGQVLFPIKQMMEIASRATSDKINQVRALLEQEIDPGRETTTLGRTLKNLRELFDPKRADSLQASFDSALRGLSSTDGALAKTVRQVVLDSVKPLAEEVDQLAKEIRGREAARSALLQTTHKGFEYEDQVMAELVPWAKVAGAELNRVGNDNRPGDFVLQIAGNALSGKWMKIVVEVRNRQVPAGRKSITDCLSRAMAERDASAAVFVARSPEGLGREIGEWCEGIVDRGPYVACIDDHLCTALRFLIVQHRLTELKASMPEVDAELIRLQVARIRTSLDRLKNVSKKVTEIRAGASDIQNEAESLRDDVRAALSFLEDAITGSNVRKMGAKVG
jgi:hypothetical protein